jgi:hypothetical protein
MRLSSSQFMLFGMGSKRRKLVYTRGGRLLDEWTLEVLREWHVETESFVPSEYCVRIRDRSGKEIVVFEDEEGVWVKENESIEPLTLGERVNLPRLNVTLTRRVCGRFTPKYLSTSRPSVLSLTFGFTRDRGIGMQQ